MTPAPVPRINATARLVSVALFVAVIGGVGWWGMHRTGKEWKAFLVETEVEARHVRINWATARRATSVLSVRSRQTGDEMLVAAGGAPVWQHSLRLALPPGVPHAVAIVLPDGQRHPLGDLAVPADALAPQDLEVVRSTPTAAEVRLRTLVPTRATLAILRDGEPLEIGEEEAATEHRIRLDGLGLETQVAEPVLRLESGDGLRRDVSLPAEDLQGTLVQVEAFLERAERRYLPLLSRVFDGGALGAGRAAVLVAELAAAGFEADWRLHGPRIREVLADPGLHPDRVHRIYQRLTRLEDVDSVLWYLEAESPYRVADAYTPHVLRQERREMISRGPNRMVLPAGVETTISPLLSLVDGRQPVDRVVTEVVVSREELARTGPVRLVVQALAINAGTVLDAWMDGELLCSLRTLGIWRFQLREESPNGELETSVLEARFPRHLLHVGRNRIELRARPLTGIPLGENGALGEVSVLLD
jgi:hypothetical protein